MLYEIFWNTHGEGYITADIESAFGQSKMIPSDPFRGNHFDVVLCNHVLEQVARRYQSHDEFNRVLQPVAGPFTSAILLTLP